jgi:hypothetical protein
MTHMSALVLKLEGHVQHVTRTTTSDGQEVFGVIEFMKLVCKSKNKDYATQVWRGLQNKPEMEGLVVIVPLRIKTSKSRYKQPPPVLRPGPATTRAGLQTLLLVLGDKVKDEFRQVDDSSLNRFMLGDDSMLIEFDFTYDNYFSNGQNNGQKSIHYNHYNFMPPAYTPNNE